MNNFLQKDVSKKRKNPVRAGLSSSVSVLAKKTEEEEESFVGEKTMDTVDTVGGKICFLEAPALDTRKLQGLNVSDKMWRRVYNVLYWYGNPEKGDFLIPETFSALYGCLYGESFGPQLFGVDNLQRIFQHFQEWTLMDLDPAGFFRLQLRQAPAPSVRGIATMSASYGKKSMEMKRHPLTFYLKDSEEEEEDLMKESLHENFPDCPPDSVSIPKAMVDNDLRFCIYYLILRHFPNGMDIREFGKSWHEKYGKPFNPQTTYNCSLDHIVQVYMKDVLYIEKKSPVHSIISSRLDIPVEIPKQLLEKVDLSDAYRTIREVQNPTNSVRLKTKMAAAFFPVYSSTSSSVTADEAGKATTSGLPSEDRGVKMPDEIQTRLRMYLEAYPGGITFTRFHNFILESGIGTWGLSDAAGESEDRLKLILEDTGVLDVKFSGRNWWLKLKEDSWCSLYWSEMEDSLDEELKKSAVSPVRETDPNGTRDDSAFWSPSGSNRSEPAFTPVSTVSGASTNTPKARDISGQDEAQFWLNKAMEMAKIGAASIQGITIPEILRNLKGKGVQLGKDQKAELHKWVVTCQKFSLHYDELDIMRFRSK